MNKEAKILIVDDEAYVRSMMQAVLADEGYSLDFAEDGAQALEKICENPPDVILLDITMPGKDGIEVVQELKENEKTRLIPVVMVTALKGLDELVRALDAGADDFLNKPVNITELKTRVRSLVKVKTYNDHLINYQKELEREVQKQTADLRKAADKIKKASLDTIYRLSRAAEYKDEETGNHIMRVSRYSAAIARQLGMGNGEVENILYATPMHDVGKIGIPDHILLKPGKLNSDEFSVIKTHTTIGKGILEGSDSTLMQTAEIVAFTHHEKWDGTGYPQGLKGKKIPRASRIMSVADVFDALTSKRPYKVAFPVDRSLDIMKQNRATHFDPEILDAFFSIKEQILRIKEEFRDSQRPVPIKSEKKVRTRKNR